MDEHPRSIEDGKVGRGSVNAVRRVGDSVLRPLGPWSPAVHDLLRHLASSGFEVAPRYLSVDAQGGYERLSYIHGEVAMRPWPVVLRTEAGVAQVGRVLRAYHACVAGYRPAASARWRLPGARWEPGMIVRHGDLGPWNSVWEGDRLVGLIDWDFAEPGYPIDDLAQAAWYFVPLRPDARCGEAGVAPDERYVRLAALCDAAGVSIRSVLDALPALQQRERSRLRTLGARGIEPWASFARRGDIVEMTSEIQWLRGWIAARGLS